MTDWRFGTIIGASWEPTVRLLLLALEPVWTASHDRETWLGLVLADGTGYWKCGQIITIAPGPDAILLDQVVEGPA